MGATDASNALASFSDHGPDMDLVAPGKAVYVEKYTSSGWGYGGASGTSLSSPLVAAAGAMLMALGADNEEAYDYLVATTLDLGDAGRDDSFGEGLIQPAEALDAWVVDNWGGHCADAEVHLSDASAALSDAAAYASDCGADWATQAYLSQAQIFASYAESSAGDAATEDLAAKLELANSWFDNTEAALLQAQSAFTGSCTSGGWGGGWGGGGSGSTTTAADVQTAMDDAQTAMDAAELDLDACGAF